MADSQDDSLTDQKAVRYRRLPVIKLGGETVRFLEVNEENKGVQFPESPLGSSGTLLFFASDVLGASSIQRKNHIRVHARFAKLGLATKVYLEGTYDCNGLAPKVYLEGFKIEHINSSSPIWFYSIKGLFRVAFELGHEPFQRDCLTILQSEWLKRFEDKPLEPELHVRYNLHLKPNGDDNMSRRNCEITIKQEPSNDNEIRMIIVEENVPSSISNIYHSSTSGRELVNEGQELNNEMFFNEFDAFLERSLSKANPRTQTLISEVVITCKYLRSVMGDKLDMLQDTVANTTLINLMDEYMTLINDPESFEDINDHFGLTREKYTLLYVISDWLGREFHDLEEEVALKVLAFQKRNIHNVLNLPPPEETIDTFYPPCMKSLIINWMGEQTTYQAQNGSSGTSYITSDHDYCGGLERQMLQTSKLSLAQLVLEFLTNLPVSGITLAVLTNLRVNQTT